MNDVIIKRSDDYLAHHGIKGMKWGIRHDPERVGRNGISRTPDGQLKTNDPYDHCMWKVNKDDLSVQYLDLIEYLLNIDDNVSKVDLNTLKRAS